MTTKRKPQNSQPMLSPIDGFVEPNALELEEAILGALLLESTSINRIEDTLRPSDFYSEQNRLIFDAIIRLNEESKPIDVLTVFKHLEKKGSLIQVGGATRLGELTSKIASTAHLEYHAAVVRQKAIERETILNARKTIGEIQQGFDIEDVLFESGKRIEELQEKIVGGNEGCFIEDIIKKADIDLAARMDMARRNIRSGVDTGLADLNKRTNGWQKSDLIILAARPAMGKTALLLHFAKAAAKNGVPVCLFSLEMSDVSLVNRMILSIADVDSDRFKSGYISNEEYARIQEAMRELSKLPIYIDDNPSASMGYIRAKCRILKKQGKCGMVYVDYLQLSEGDDKSGSREQEVSKMSRMAKKIARELEVPFMLLSQLNRAVEQRTDKRPIMADLRESGSIEQDADMVIFIHRPGYYGVETKDKYGNVETNYGELIIAKFRNGAVGTEKFKHNDNLTRFFDYEKSIDRPIDTPVTPLEHDPIAPSKDFDVPF